ncbi:protease [Gossypium australe]|uniref:Protease n=1 Tax=Gossypium australe TaxID=47621 RepID=A0A5B6VLW5_9ROSI|nr:protease [Gossypium australe]
MEKFRCLPEVWANITDDEILSSSMRSSANSDPKSDLKVEIGSIASEGFRGRNDRNVSDVITIIFTIHSVSYFALIDIGSTHSYVTCNMLDKLGGGVEETITDVTIVCPLRQSVIVNKIYRRYSLEISGVVFPTNLMELPFGDFNLILSMDWLVEHQVSLDCSSKRVTLKIAEASEVVMVEERQNYLSYVIFVMVIEKLVRKGCELI